jgi:hypothetical protein
MCIISCCSPLSTSIDLFFFNSQTILFCDARTLSNKTELTGLAACSGPVFGKFPVRILVRTSEILTDDLFRSIIIFFLQWRSAPLSGHDLPDLLPPTFCLPCCCLPVPCLEQLYSIPLSILPSTSRLSHRLLPPKHPPIAFCGTIHSHYAVSQLYSLQAERCWKCNMIIQFVDLLIVSNTSYSLGLRGSEYFSEDFPVELVDHFHFSLFFCGKNSMCHCRLGHWCGQVLFAKSLRVDSRIVTFYYATNACFQVVSNSYFLTCPSVPATNSEWCKINRVNCGTVVDSPCLGGS